MKFSNSVPPRPTPVDPFNPWREFLHMQAADETQQFLGQLIDYIQRFQEVKVLDANGQIVTALAMPSGEGDATASGTTPFSVVASEITDSNGNPTGAWQCYIYQGDLRDGIGFILRPITGLTLQSDLDANPPTPSYRPLIANDAIWLELELYDDASVAYTVIKSWGDGDTGFDPNANFGTVGAYVELDNSDPSNVYVRYVRILIAYSIAGADGQPVLTQCVDRNLMLLECAPNGYACVYPFEAFKGYPGVTAGSLHGSLPDSGGGGGGGGPT